MQSSVQHCKTFDADYFQIVRLAKLKCANCSALRVGVVIHVHVIADAKKALFFDDPRKEAKP